MNIEYWYLILLIPGILLALYLKLSFKLRRGKKLKDFATENDFHILNIEDVQAPDSASYEGIKQHFQTTLYRQISSDADESWLFEIGYFDNLHLESVLTKSDVKYNLSVVEISATLDLLVEQPDIRRQYRYKEWEGNVAIFQFPQQSFNRKIVKKENWRICYQGNRIVAFRYDYLNLKALWSINSFGEILNEIKRLI